LYDASWDEWGHDPHLPITIADLTTPVTRHLDALRLPYRLFHHPGPVNSLAQAALERNQQPEQVVRSIVFRLAEDRYAMVLMAGARQVDWRTLRRTLGQSRLTMAREEELLAATGYPIGAVSPFGLPGPMPLYVDESVLAEEEISLGSGLRGTTIILRSADLLPALQAAGLDARIGQFGSKAGTLPAHTLAP
jgi:Cys-tRNA(Pro) deacylase